LTIAFICGENRWTFIIAAICGVFGIVVTYFFVPDMKGKDLASEDENFVRYLTDNGWEGHVGEYPERTLPQPMVLNISREEGSEESVHG
jgi:Sugar (and other) transporter